MITIFWVIKKWQQLSKIKSPSLFGDFFFKDKKHIWWNTLVSFFFNIHGEKCDIKKYWL
jgi:hypothetical protein